MITEKEQGNLFAAAGATLAIGFVSYWIFYLLIGAVCRQPFSGYSYSFDPTLTALALAGCTGVLSFIFILVVGVFDRPDKLEKGGSIIAAGWALVWLAYTFAVGDFCWDSTIRTAVTYLFVPVALIALAIVGRRWLNASHD